MDKIIQNNTSYENGVFTITLNVDEFNELDRYARRGEKQIAAARRCYQKKKALQQSPPSSDEDQPKKISPPKLNRSIRPNIRSSSTVAIPVTSSSE